MVRVISIDQWFRLWDIIHKWQKQTNNVGVMPNWAIVDGIKIYKAQIKDMYDRVVAYKASHNNAFPGTIGIEGPAPSRFNPVNPKNTVSFTTWYNSMIGTGYAHYNGDKYNPKEEEYNLAHHIAMNCSDYAQTATRKAEEFGGYQTRYIHVICQSDEGHVYIQIKGREFADWTDADVAAAASVGSKYPLGQVWCPKPKDRWISKEPWLTKNDGIT
jgi:hypothetical protein